MPHEHVLPRLGGGDGRRRLRAMRRHRLTLVGGDLTAAADAIRLSRATLRAIKQNLGWAFG